MRTSLFGIMFVCATFVSAAAYANDCNGCADLKKIAQEYKVKTDAAESAYDGLQLKATSIIQRMPDKSGNLNRAQVKEIVNIIKIAAPVDPSEAIVMNNIEIIDKNKALFDKEIASLSKNDRKELNEALAVARSTKPDEVPQKKN